MEKTAADHAQDYLSAKKDLLTQCVRLTAAVAQQIGNIPQTHKLLGERKQLLAQMTRLDETYAPLLAGYVFDEAQLEPIAALAEQMWTIDDHLTEAMRSNKTDIQDFLNELNLEALNLDDGQ